MYESLCAQCGTRTQRPHVILDADAQGWQAMVFDSADCFQSWLARTGRTYEACA